MDRLGRDVVHEICTNQVVVTLQACVKELVENSLDAGATRIEVRLRESGGELLEVVDDGSGISPDDYAKLATRHATSKIKEYNDLSQSLSTFGFRGEALSGICAMGEVTVCTRTRQDTQAVLLTYDRFGKLISQSPAAREVGTTISVRELFRRLPVRHREFLRNAKAQVNATLRLIQACAIAQPSIKFHVVAEKARGSGAGRASLLSTSGSVRGWREAAAAVLGDAAITDVIPLELQSAQTGWTVSGIVSTPNGGRRSRDTQLFYVNRRPIDPPKRVAKLINDTYHQYNSRQWPVVILSFSASQGLVDVNVTPDKRTVFLHNEEALLSDLQQGLTELYAPAGGGSNDAGGGLSLSVFGIRSKSTGAQPKAVEGQLALAEDEVRTLDNGAICASSGVCGGDDADFETPPRKPALPASRVIAQAHVEVAPSNGLKELRSLTRVHSEPIDLDEGGLDFHGVTIEHVGVKDYASGSIALDSGGAADLELETLEVEVLAPAAASPESRPAPTSPTAVAAEDTEEFRLLEEYIPPSSVEGGDGGRASPPGGPRQEGFRIVGANPLAPTAGDNENGGFAGVCAGTVEEELSRNIGIAEQDFHLVELVPCTAQQDSQLVELTPPEPLPIADGEGVRDEEAMLVKGIRRGAEGLPDLPATEPVEISVSMEVLRASISRRRQRRGCVSTAKAVTSQAPAVMFPSAFSLASLRAQGDGPGGARSALEEVAKFATDGAVASADDKGTGAGAADAFRFDKSCFTQMRVIGQFNLGFIIAALRTAGNDGVNGREGHGGAKYAAGLQLFIIDQHASDEKYRFEALNRDSKVDRQPLVSPYSLQLTPAQEQLAMAHVEVFKLNGFELAADDGKLPGRRLRLTALPTCQGLVFGERDVHDLLYTLEEAEAERTQPSTQDASQGLLDLAGHRGLWSATAVPRPKKVWQLLACRACRGAIMIGKALRISEMERVLANLGSLQQPWNCPHGRPTMRHLIDAGAAWRVPSRPPPLAQTLVRHQ